MSEMRLGNPWHGAYSAAGLTLAGGMLHTEWMPSSSRPGDTHYVNFGMPAAPVPLAHEAAQGMVWKNDMVLTGLNKNWSPINGLAIGQNAWIYKASDGTVFKLSIIINLSTGGVQVYGRKFGGTDALMLSFTIPLASSSSADYYEINQSPTGDRALLCVGKKLTTVDFYGTTYSYCNKFEYFGELTLSGGTALALPGISNSNLYTYSTVNAVPANWTNPSNRNILNPVRDVYQEGIGYVSGTGVVMVGYSKAGVRQVIATLSTNWVLQTSSGGATPANVGDTRHDEFHSTWVSQIIVNGAVAYASPMAEKHLVADTTYVLEGSLIVGHTTTTTDEEINYAYNGKVFEARLLSNCISAFGQNMLASDPTYVSVVFTPDGQVSAGPLSGLQMAGSDVNSVSAAAYNWRDGTLLSGTRVGFI